MHALYSDAPAGRNRRAHAECAEDAESGTSTVVILSTAKDLLFAG
jgi:hypothetical protein